MIPLVLWNQNQPFCIHDHELAHYYWKGTILPTEKSILYKQKLGSLRRENKTKMYTEPSSASPFEGNVVHPMMLGAANKAQQQLSVQELIELATPDNDTLEKLSFGKLLVLSKFLMTEGVLKGVTYSI
jgi:hypothetical protein